MLSQEVVVLQQLVVVLLEQSPMTSDSSGLTGLRAADLVQ